MNSSAHTKKKLSRKKILSAIFFLLYLYVFSYLILSGFGEYKFIIVELEEGNQISDYVWKPPLIEWNLLSKKNNDYFYRTNIVGYFYYPLAYLDIGCLHKNDYNDKTHLLEAIDDIRNRLLEERGSNKEANDIIIK